MIDLRALQEEEGIIRPVLVRLYLRGERAKSSVTEKKHPVDQGRIDQAWLQCARTTKLGEKHLDKATDPSTKDFPDSRRWDCIRKAEKSLAKLELVVCELELLVKQEFLFPV